MMDVIISERPKVNKERIISGIVIKILNFNLEPSDFNDIKPTTYPNIITPKRKLSTICMYRPIPLIISVIMNKLPKRAESKYEVIFY